MIVKGNHNVRFDAASRDAILRRKKTQLPFQHKLHERNDSTFRQDLSICVERNRCKTIRKSLFISPMNRLYRCRSSLTLIHCLCRSTKALRLRFRLNFSAAGRCLSLVDFIAGSCLNVIVDPKTKVQPLKNFYCRGMNAPLSLSW